MPVYVSAASRLRDEVLSVPSTMLLQQGGFVDRVIRVLPLPGRKFNLDIGPDIEAWNEIQRLMFLHSRRDKPVPLPLAVSENTREEFSVRSEDVPTVTLVGYTPEGEAAAAEPAAAVVPKAEAKVNPFQCTECDAPPFKNEVGVRMHKVHKHKEE